MLKQKILLALERNIGEVVTGGQLALSLGVTRNSIWKSVRSLQSQGAQIVSIPNVGYKLLDTSDTLSLERISSHLRTCSMGRSMEILPVVHSTNQYLKELAQAAGVDGHTVIANEQTHGRGRRGREFRSPRDEGVYMSVLLKYGAHRPQDLRLLTIAAAVAASRAIEEQSPVKADIKWVNDIYAGGKKLCGILTEAVYSAELGEVDSVIVGFGINTGAVPYELRDYATSICELTGKRGVRNPLIGELLNQFETVYGALAEGRTREIIAEYDRRMFIKGQTITVCAAEGDYSAKAIGIANSGALIVESTSGDIRHISTGEIKLKRG